MADVAVAEELAGSGELEELWKLNASETEYEDDDEEYDDDEDDEDEDEDEDDEEEPEDMPHP